MRLLSRYGNNRNGNILIEGDNADVIPQLLQDYGGLIDVIAIDPPYNTEIEYIGYQDSNFSSGWGEFIKKRLEISKDLLTETGVVFINIDENELFNLLGICYGLFGKNNVNILVWPKIDPIFDKNRIEKPIINIKSSHEYIILCYMDKFKTKFNPTSSGHYLESIVKGLGTTSSAKDEISDLFGDRNGFSTPKPMRLMKELIRISSGNGAIILDYFAGSGTIGHACMDLNNEDNGSRRFILVNSNENNICKEITFQRLVKAIETNYYDEGFDFYSII